MAALLAGCEAPARIALPAPVPLTQGGTVVPAHGAGLGIDFGDGFLGQELMRTEILAVGLMRLHARQSSALSAHCGESSLDCVGHQSGHADVLTSHGEAP